MEFPKEQSQHMLKAAARSQIAYDSLASSVSTSSPSIKPELLSLIKELHDPSQRSKAIIQLATQFTNDAQDVARALWFTSGSLSFLVHELLKGYEVLTVPHIYRIKIQFVANVLELFRFIAHNPDTAAQLVNSGIMVFILPYLQLELKKSGYDQLRMTTLGIIEALSTSKEVEVLNFLIGFEIFSLCLRILEGPFTHQDLALSILHHLMESEHGRRHATSRPERIQRILSALQRMVHPRVSEKMLCSVLNCHLVLTLSPQTHTFMIHQLPKLFINSKFIQSFDGSEVGAMVKHLFRNLGLDGAGNPALRTGFQSGIDLNYNEQKQQQLFQQQQQLFQQQQRQQQNVIAQAPGKSVGASPPFYYQMTPPGAVAGNFGSMQQQQQLLFAQQQQQQSGQTQGSPVVYFPSTNPLALSPNMAFHTASSPLTSTGYTGPYFYGASSPAAHGRIQESSSPYYEQSSQNAYYMVSPVSGSPYGHQEGFGGATVMGGFHTGATVGMASGTTGSGVSPASETGVTNAAETAAPTTTNATSSIKTLYDVNAAPYQPSYHQPST